MTESAHLTPEQAWQRALQTLIRHPWLPLIPSGWNVVQFALAWLGIPQGPVPDVSRLADNQYQAFLSTPPGPDADLTLRVFFPSWLPGTADLKIPIQPERLAVPVGLSPAATLAGLLLVPLLHALAQAAFLALVATAVNRGVPQLRRILRAVPGLYIIGVLWRMALMVVPLDGLMVMGLIWVLLFPLLPLIIAAGDRPLGVALIEAPGQLWGRLGAWFGVGWRPEL